MTFGITGNIEKKQLAEVLGGLVRRFQREGVDFAIEKSLLHRLMKKPRSAHLKRARGISEARLPQKCSVIIALGGDGTMLRAARVAGKYETPILGVNLGKLGFLAEVSREELDAAITDILEGKYLLEDRMVLEAVIQGSTRRFVALNDIVVEKYGTSRVIDIETYVNKDFLATYTADGIILSTPTGSTAYSLANGGPIVVPTSSVITVNPICPHTLTARAVIVPDTSTVVVRIPTASVKVHLTADGQLDKLLSSPAEVVIRKSPHKARLIKRVKSSYYDVLRKKLSWASDIRSSHGS